jgi:protocatechuate 3,4-dioxygenase beta subunit
VSKIFFLFLGVLLFLSSSLVASATISGTVTSQASGSPISGATVTIIKGSNQIIATTTTLANGTYTFTGINAGQYTVTASATGYQAAVVGVQARNNEITVVNFALLSNPGTVSGTVTAANTGLPISGATVEVNFNNVVIFSTLTNGSGNYTIAGVPPGTYVIHAHAMNYQTGIVGAIVQSDQTTTVNFSLQSNPGTISGTVTAANTGSPISGATVEVNLNNVVIFSTLTNGSGNYTITGVPPGSYVMHAHSDTYQTGILGAVVQSDQTTTVNFSLQSNPGTVSGTVTSASSGLPIAGATVEVNIDGVVLYSTLTDPSGQYLIAGVPPGSYIIHAHATNYQTGILGANVQSDQTTTVNFSLQPNPGTVAGRVTDASTMLPIAGVTVEANQNNIVIALALTDSSGNYSIPGLAPGAYIMHAHSTTYQVGILGANVQSDQTTTVNFSLQSNPGTVAGQVINANTMLPLAGVTVEANQNNIVIASTLTDSSGNYSIPGLAPGSYIMHAHSTTYQVGILGANVQSDQTTTVNFSLQPNPGTVAGQVVDSSTMLPIAGVTVEANQNNIVIAFSVTDSSGNYTIPGLAPGSYIMHAHATTYQVGSLGATVQSDQTTTVNFSLQADPGTVAGQVVDASTMLPIAGVTVEANQNNIVIAFSVTDSSGNYIIPGLASGAYIIHAHSATYQVGISEATVQSDQTTTVNFSLQGDPGTAAGRVVDANTMVAIPGAIVEANQNNIVIAFTLTDSSGNYSIPGLAPGSYIMHAHATDYQIGIQNATVTSDHTTTVNFSLSGNASTVQGVVTNVLTTNPISGAFVQVFQSGSLLATTITSVSGNYSISILPAGTFTLNVSATDYYTKTQSFSLSLGETKTVNVALMPDSPPENLTGEVINNRFLLQADRIHHIQWEPSQDPTVIRYQVYRNGGLLAVISPNSPLMYDDHHCSSSRTDVYSVNDVNANGDQSSSVSISLR